MVRYLADRIAVLYLGRVMEIGPAEEVFAGPHHPYTDALLSAVPSLDGEQRASASASKARSRARSIRPTGCVFHTRCRRKIGPICATVEPAMVAVGEAHQVRCHLPPAELDRGFFPVAEHQ